MADPIRKREYEVTLSNEKTVKLSCREPNQKESQEAEFEYSKSFNKALMGGIMPQARLMDELVKNGIWSDEKDQEIEAQREKVIKLEDAFEKEKDEDRKKSIGEDLKEERQSLYSMRQAKSEMFAHSAEAKADSAQRDYLVAVVTKEADTGRKVWKRFEDFQNEQDGGLLFRSTYEYLTFINGLDSDFMEKFPENQDKESEEESEKTEESPKEEPQPEDQTEKVVSEEGSETVSASVEG